MRHIDAGKLLMLLSCVLLLFSFNACSTDGVGVYVGDEPQLAVRPHPTAGPPPHAPAHGYRAKYKYHYYPDEHVYFDVSRGLYFYLEGDEWRVSASLPAHLHVQLGDYVTVELDSDEPYSHFEHHKDKYPPGQMKKKSKGKKSH